MAVTTRQSSLLVSEDWTKIYQTFRNADFQSYDFQTLRKSMIDYLRVYYPEDYNDFIESSEFIALIDLIAFLGQSLSFRADLNARENFIDTAQRRDSILKLARLISYNPKRNITSSGFLKVNSVSTTENLFDSNGLNLSGLVINWNDASNSNWLEQMTIIINASLVANQAIGKPSHSQIINNIQNDEYQINLIPGIVPTYSFNATVEGISTAFEVVSPTSVNAANIYENPPIPGSPFNLLYKKDNLGNNSVNTGFFMFFKQGELKYVDFNFQESIPNRVFSINADNVNNTDVWLYSLNNQRQPDIFWEPVPLVANNNVIYNNLINKNTYQINSRAGDQVDLVFGDGAFANIPQGNFKAFYRVSSGLKYKITPDEMTNIVIPINYVSKAGRIETITFRASLQYTVANSNVRESLEDVRLKAPQQYYTQNRMVNGEDYNILPYTLFSNVVKVKAVNRTSSGISRYLDVIDTTGKYSSTNIFADDGYLYRDEFEKTRDISFTSKTDILEIISNDIPNYILTTRETLQFFYSNYSSIALNNICWNFSASVSDGTTGYFFNPTGGVIPVGNTASATSNGYITYNSIIKFYAGDGYHFNAQNQIVQGPVMESGDKTYIYAAVKRIVNDGSNNGLGNFGNGLGPVTLGTNIPTGAFAVAVFQRFETALSQTVKDQMLLLIGSFKEFGLRYDSLSYQWKLIDAADLKIASYDNLFAGDTSGKAQDASWIIRFEKVSAGGFRIHYRGTNYVFESAGQTNFYYDTTVKIYDTKTGLTVKDSIKVLKVNSAADATTTLESDYTWQVYNNIVEVDGYSNSNRILVSFFDSNNDGLPDNPELFESIVSPSVNSSSKLVFFKQTNSGYDNFIVKTPIDKTTINSSYEKYRDLYLNRSLYVDGQLFYLTIDKTFWQLTVTGIAEGLNVAVYTLTQLYGYSAEVGRQGLYFQYRHNSPNYRRIDPSPNNIIDIYMLTKQYADDYQNWIQDITGKVAEPTVPTSDELSLEFSALENYKSLSDSLIFNSVKFKPVFGNKANQNLQAIFKVVKNPSVTVSDNDIKSSVVAEINNYFNIVNWDFGDTFYFSELSTYLHNRLTPSIASITIVPVSTSNPFGSLMQINADFNEIIISAATVDNVEIISAITAAQINQTGVI